MSEENKGIYRRFIDEVMFGGNLAALDDYLAPGLVDHSKFNPSGDREGVRQGLAMMRAALPDARYVAEDLLADGDKVISRYTLRATHKGEFMGAAPTGKEVTLTGIEIVRFAGGKMVEHWEEYDALGLMEQLGIIPALAPAP